MGAALLGAVFFFGSYIVWGLMMLVAALAGFRLASSVSDPSMLAVVKNQLREAVVPFLPAALLTGVLLGGWLSRKPRSTAASALVAGAAAVLTFALTPAVLLPLTAAPGHGGYAAERGMEAIVYVLAGILGFTAVPFWVAGALLLRRVLGGHRAS